MIKMVRKREYIINELMENDFLECESKIISLEEAEDEWNGKDFGLNFGTRVNFIHIPIQMKRDEENVLVGEYSWKPS